MVTFDGRNLVFSGKKFTPSIRKISDLKPVLLHPTDSDDPAYYMYRGVCSDTHKHIFEKWRIRYDVTVIPPRNIGGEYIKTFGHFHPRAKDGVEYPEIYEVIEGKALYLLQRRDCLDFICVRAEKGDVVVIPPSYGHVTVNPSDSILVMSNLVSSSFTSDYEPVRRKNGFMYYYTENGWVKNRNYENHPKIREFIPKSMFSDIYTLFTEYPKFFDWLDRPAKLDWNEDLFLTRV